MRMNVKKIRRDLKRFRRQCSKAWRNPARQRQVLLAGCGLAILMFIMAAQMIRPSNIRLSYGSGVTIGWLSPEVQRWRGLIEQTAKKYDIDPDLVAIIITLESAGDPSATSPIGAQGLMQVMPLTAQDIARKFLRQPVPEGSYDIYDPATNIEFGTAYLAYLRDHFADSPKAAEPTGLIELVASGYNGGPGTAAKLEQGQAGDRVKENIDYTNGAAIMWRERAAAIAPTIYR